MTKIAVFTVKGGVGKTVSVLALAVTLALSSKKVLLVDTDLNADLTYRVLGSKTYMFSIKDGNSGGMGAISLYPNKPPKPIEVTKNLDILPMEEDALVYVKNDMIMNALSKIDDSGYDLVLIDTPPSYDSVAASSMLSNIDAYYTIVNPAMPSIRILRREITEMIPMIISKLRKQPVLLGIIINNSTLTRSEELMKPIYEFNEICENIDIPKVSPCVFNNMIAHSQKIINYDKISGALLTHNTKALKLQMSRLNMAKVAEELLQRIEKWKSASQ